MSIDADGSRAGGSATWPVRVAALAGAALYAWWFYPGVLSFDAAYAWWQVRGGETSDQQAPMMMRVWQLCDALVPGPGLLFLLHLAMFWTGLALIATTLRARWPLRIGFMLIAAGAPVTFVMFSHIWTDVALMAALTLATGTLLHLRESGRSRWLLPTGIALFYGLGVRFNAWPAVLPLVVYTVAVAWPPGRDVAHRTPAMRRGRIALISTAALLALGLGAAAVNARVDRHVALLPVLELCDLAAMSASTGILLLPDFALRRGSDVETFRRARRPWSCLPLYAGMREPSGAHWTPAERRALTHAWLAAIARHPLDYLRHRARLLLALVGPRDAGWPYQLVFVDANVHYGDNPPLPARTGAVHGFWMRMFHRFWDTQWLAAWPYLLMAWAALATAWWRRSAVDVGAALAVAASGLLYALPYCVVVASAELRYLAWTCLSAVLSVGLVLLAPARPMQTRTAKLVSDGG